jgi:hypothetical protein
VRADKLDAVVTSKGVIRYGGKLYPARHEPTIDEETGDQANNAFGNGREDADGLRYRDDHVHLLKGVLRCGTCRLAMTPYRSGKRTKDGTPYRYYACVDYTKAGSQTTCPVKMLPARDFEAVVKRVLADLGNHPTILQACVDAANREAVQSVPGLEAALARHREEAGRLTRSIRRLIDVMKQEDLLAEDIKEEYRRLVREAADSHPAAAAVAWATTSNTDSDGSASAARNMRTPRGVEPDRRISSKAARLSHTVTTRQRVESVAPHSRNVCRMPGSRCPIPCRYAA